MQFLAVSRQIAVFAATVALAPGCASIARRHTVQVTYLSDPPGARVYWRGQQFPAPMYVRYQTPRAWRECVTSEPVTVRWVSGAEVDVDALDLCPATGRQQQFTVFRPKGVDGVDIDAQYAAALLTAAAPAAPVSPTPIPAPTTCTTSVIGNQIFTTCQ